VRCDPGRARPTQRARDAPRSAKSSPAELHPQRAGQR
jgi:hypothetical protein